MGDLVKNFSGCDEAILAKCDVYVCPSNLHLAMVHDKFNAGIMVTPQNCNFKGCGAFTGEMAVDQMVDLGLKCCLIGHSERRGEFGVPLPLREKGLEALMTEAIIPQLSVLVPLLKGLEDKSRLVIAYEPVLAIGTGVTASPEQAQETHKAIRDWIAANVDQK